MKQLFAMLVLCMSIIFGCRNSENIAGPGSIELHVFNNRPGNFSINAFSSIKKTDNYMATSVLGDTISFDVGNLMSSRNFYFLIQNTGNYAIDSIKIVSGDSTMSVSPQTLYKLNSKDSSSSISPLVTSTLYHGNILENGVGFKPVLKQGKGFSNFTITGITSDSSGKRIELKVNVKLEYFALLLDFELYSNTGLIDSKKPFAYYSGWSTLSGSVPVYVPTYRTHDDSINNYSGVKLVNTGNSTLYAFYYKKYSGTVVLVDSIIMKILPLDTLKIKTASIILPGGIILDNTTISVAVSSNNIICNPYKWLMEQDGRVCFAIKYNK